MAERALDHIQIAGSFWGHRKTLKLIRLVGTPPEGWMLIIRLWELSRAQKPNGQMDKETCEILIDQAGAEAGIKGRRENLFGAVRSSGFIEPVKAGQLLYSDKLVQIHAEADGWFLHGWYEHAGQGIVERLKAIKRKQKGGGKDDEKGGDFGAPVRGSSPNRGGSSPNGRAKGEKRIEDSSLRSESFPGSGELPTDSPSELGSNSSPTRPPILTVEQLAELTQHSVAKKAVEDARR